MARMTTDSARIEMMIREIPAHRLPPTRAVLLLRQFV